jgi:hypothetical protein
MKTLKILQIFSLVALAAFTGAFLFIAMVIVPFWLASEPDYFLNWFTNNFFRFPILMIPLNLIAFLTTLITLIVAWKSAANTKFWWSGATMFIFLASITYPLYFASANAEFLNHTIELELVANKIAVWSNWNWLRTVLSFAALILGVIGIDQLQENIK